MAKPNLFQSDLDAFFEALRKLTDRVKLREDISKHDIENFLKSCVPTIESRVEALKKASEEYRQAVDVDADIAERESQYLGPRRK